MKKTILFLTAALVAAVPLGAGQQPQTVPSQAQDSPKCKMFDTGGPGGIGYLEYFLTTTKDAKVTEKPLGEMGGKDKAAFFAVIASAGEAPEQKGMRIHLEKTDTGCSEDVYLDYAGSEGRPEGLAHFEEELRSLVTRKEMFLKEPPTPPGGYPTTSAYNRCPVPDAAGRPCGGNFFHASWSGVPDGPGVMLTSTKKRGSYYFPGADLQRVVDMVAAARAYLSAN